MTKQWITTQQSELEEVAKAIVKYIRYSSVLALVGDLGAGKTTLVQQMCKILGFTGTVQSPTYSLVNVYPLTDDQNLYHLDLYRIETEDEALSLDTETYLYPNGWSFIEWPQIIEPYLPEDTWLLRIETDDQGARVYTLTQPCKLNSKAE